jgi:glycosyltransferase involved in cell wall biosynthesis
MQILFAFENPLPNAEADAEVFMATARHLAPLASQSWLHIPASDAAHCKLAADLAGIPVIRARAPLRPAALRHFACGSVVLRREFRQADLVYTRNLWIAWAALSAGQRVAFDHYRPWPDQVPPLRPWIHRLMCNRRFLVNITHSEYTRSRYLELGIPPEKLVCVHNGFDPRRFEGSLPLPEAKRRIGIEAARKTVVYTGRVNHKKGLELVIEAAKSLPDHLFLLVGSYGTGPIEALAKDVANVRPIPWQRSPEALRPYLDAADVLLIPPSLKPLAEFGSTVIPLKLYLYMGAGRPILAGDTPDVREILQNGRNAVLCRPDRVESLIAGVRTLTGDSALAQRLAATALADSRGFTWTARAGKIASILEARLASAPIERRVFSRAQSRAWVEQSRRWAIHLVRKRSWVLPARAYAAAITPADTGTMPVAASVAATETSLQAPEGLRIRAGADGDS